MSYQLTSATDINNLLDKLATFATAAGWTVDYNAAGPPRQIGLHLGNCAIALGGRTSEMSLTHVVGSTTYYDAVMSMALSTSITPGNQAFWGHPGSLVTTESDTDRIRVNDLYGSFSNVWFFSDDASFIHAIVQMENDRYTHFGFGVLDKVGMTHSDIGWAAGQYHEWWPNGTSSNDPESTSHFFGQLAREAGSHVYIPSGVLPSGYPAAGVYKGSSYLTLVMTRANADSDHWASSTGKLLDFFMPVHNQLTTGGTVLYGVPWLMQESSSGLSHVYLGHLPNFRIANIEQYSPAEELTYGSDTWMIFPWKRKGLRENMFNGLNPLPAANTAEYAWAIKKEV